MSTAATIIEPRPRGAFAAITEAWRHRSLVSFWGRRFVQKTYRRTVLGPIWIVLRPAIDVLSRLFIFGTILGITTGEVPYLLVLLVASSVWELFAATTYWATRALELNRRFLRRLYAPQLTMLIGALWPAMLNFVIYLAITLLAALGFLLSDGTWYPSFGLELILASAGCLLAVALALSLGLWLSVWGARARDIRFALGYVLNLWLFVTPVMYPLSRVPDGLRPILELNPMVAPVELTKAGLLGTPQPSATAMVSTVLAIALIGGFGLRFFGRQEAALVERL